MISKESGYSEAFVWIWLPGAAEPLLQESLQQIRTNRIYNY